MTTRSLRTGSAKPSVAALMAAYLADLPRADAERAAGVEQSLELLRHGLNGYGHQYLAPRDRERWSSAYEEGSEDAFCQMFGTTQLVKYIDEFLGYFLIRKVLMPEIRSPKPSRMCALSSPGWPSEARSGGTPPGRSSAVPPRLRSTCPRLSASGACSTRSPDTTSSRCVPDQPGSLMS